jgi:CheY-like chemotaxis protein
VENDLRATGYPQEQVSTFLTELVASVPPKAIPREGGVLTTRKLRSPFSLGFEGAGAPPTDASMLSDEAAAPKVLRGQTLGPGFLPHNPAAATQQPAAHRVESSFAKEGHAGVPPPEPSALADEAALRKLRGATLGPGQIQRTPAVSAHATIAKLESSFSKEDLAGGAPVAPPPPPPPPPPPQPPPQPLPARSQTQRRGTFVFDATGRPVPAAPVAPQPDALMPVGQKSLMRHDLVFGASIGTVGTLATKPLILIADDDKRARMVFRLRIEEAGFSTVECSSGDEAWQRIQQGGVAVVILDMKMPGMHGLEVLAQMAEKCASVPVIICSAYDQLQDEFVVKSYPKLRYLVKPIAPEMLVRAIRELLVTQTPQV